MLKLPGSSCKTTKLHLPIVNIAVYIPGSKNPGFNFIVETFFPLLEQIKGHRVIILTDSSKELEPLPGFEFVRVPPMPQYTLFKKIWFETTLMRLVKRTGADIFVSAANLCFLSSSMFQCILVTDPALIKEVYAKKARLIIVNSESVKKMLAGKFSIDSNKVAVLYPSFNSKFCFPGISATASTKNKYSGGKEYFLFNGHFSKQDEFIDLLKAFSYFKKRQQSSFKLIILSAITSLFEKKMESYKYKNDVVVITTNNIEEKAAITAASYAVIIPFASFDNIAVALNAMQANVPVIATNSSPVNELPGDAILFAGNEVKDMSEKMMQLYKDEYLRSQLIEKGKEAAKAFTAERSAHQLWQTILKAMN